MSISRSARSEGSVFTCPAIEPRVGNVVASESLGSMLSPSSAACLPACLAACSPSSHALFLTASPADAQGLPKTKAPLSPNHSSVATAAAAVVPLAVTASLGGFGTIQGPPFPRPSSRKTFPIAQRNARRYLLTSPYSRFSAHFRRKSRQFRTELRHFYVILTNAFLPVLSPRITIDRAESTHPFTE